MFSFLIGRKRHFLSPLLQNYWANFTQEEIITVKFHEHVTAFVSQLQILFSLLPNFRLACYDIFLFWAPSLVSTFPSPKFLASLTGCRCFSQVQEIQSLILNIFFLFCWHSLHFLVSHVFLVCLESHRIVCILFLCCGNKKFPLHCIMCITLPRTVWDRD